MGTPAAAGLHSPLSGPVGTDSGIEKERQSRSMMGTHVSDKHSFIDLH